MKNLIFILFLLLPQVLWSAASYKVTEFDGKVLARSKGSLKNIQVELNQELSPDTRVRLYEGAKLTLVTPMKDDIKLSGKTYMKLGELSGSSDGKSVCKLELFRGTSLTKVHKLKANSSFTIKTPSAVAGVRGTEFQCKVSDTGETEVTVLEGDVEVQDVDGESPPMSVKAGKKAEVKGDGKITVTESEGSGSSSSDDSPEGPNSEEPEDEPEDPYDPNDPIDEKGREDDERIIDVNIKIDLETIER